MSALHSSVDALVKRLSPEPKFDSTPAALAGEFKNLIRLHCTGQDPILLVNLARDSRDPECFTLSLGGDGRYLRSGAGMRAKADFVFRGKSKRKFDLLSYSFSVLRPESDDAAPAFVRYDLDACERPDFVDHPRAHLHPGSRDVRVLAPSLQPLELLHWFLVLARWPWSSGTEQSAEGSA